MLKATSLKTGLDLEGIGEERLDLCCEQEREGSVFSVFRTIIEHVDIQVLLSWCKVVLVGRI